MMKIVLNPMLWKRKKKKKEKVETSEYKMREKRFWRVCVLRARARHVEEGGEKREKEKKREGERERERERER